MNTRWPVRYVRRSVLLWLLVLAALSCRFGGPAEEPTEVAQVTPSPRPTNTATPRPTDTPTVTPTPGPFTANEVFNLVSPAVVYLENPIKSGSGVLLADGYILTNAHVTYPYDTVRVVFPDGSEFPEAPVVAHDLLADLALVGPVESEVQPMALTDGEALVIGSDVYVIGYPGERDDFPTPTMGQGLVSRTREWDVIGMTYFQTDAAVAGGQSGGVLVSDRGQVIGITNFAFTEARYGLIASAADIALRLEQLLNGDDPAGMGPRLKTGEVQHAPTIMIEDYYDTVLFVIFAEAGDEVEISISGSSDAGFWVDGPDGRNMVYMDESTSGRVEGSFRAQVGGPHIVGVFQYEYGRHAYAINASHSLIRVEDPDDQRIRPAWSEGQSVAYHGGIDYVGDIDYYSLFLRAGDEVDIRVDSILINPVISMNPADYTFAEELVDYDSGGGIFGVSPRLVFRAPHTGDFVLTVEDASPDSAGFGGYVLSINAADGAGPTPVAIAPTPTPIAGPGNWPMRRFESDRNHFAFLYPAFFEETDTLMGEECPGTCFAAGRAFLTITENDISELGIETITEALDATLQFIAAMDPNYQVINRGPLVTDTGLTGEMIEYTANLFGTHLRNLSFVYLDGDTAVSIVYEFIDFDDFDEEWRELILYSFSTVELTG